MIISIIILIPVTILFINRGAIVRETRVSTGVRLLAALAWFAVFGVLLSSVIGRLGLIVALAIGV